jgi:hypothetical protein
VLHGHGLSCSSVFGVSKKLLVVFIGGFRWFLVSDSFCLLFRHRSSLLLPSVHGGPSAINHREFLTRRVFDHDAFRIRILLTKVTGYLHSGFPHISEVSVSVIAVL